ncbi:MAG: hypothetical protein NVS3B17_19600 [Vulcanimicrobiaceae bacterium]
MQLAVALVMLLATTTVARADCASRANYGGGIVFVTDREPLGDDRLFGGERAPGRDDDVITTGTLTTPKPAGTRGCTSRLSFFQALNHRFSRGNGRRALVYVHGYYTSFVTAATDALALRRQLNFPGPVILYSWPATVTAKPAYGTESRNAAWSATHFAHFIDDLESHFHGMPISFVARGVGARFATAGLRIVRDPRCRQCFGRAVFLEPEIPGTLLHRKLADVRLCDVRRDARRSSAPITIYSATRRPSACSGVDTVRIAARTIAASGTNDPIASPSLANDVRLALAGTPVAMRARRPANPQSHARRRRTSDDRR